MAAFLFWLNQNWFNLLQSAGIIGSLLYTAFAIRREGRSREVSERLHLLEQHRELWGKVYDRPELKRIKEPVLDLVGEPVSVPEREFLNLVFIHFETGWRLAKMGSVNSLATMRKDVEAFFKLPIPRAVWAETRMFRDEEFCAFVDETLNGSKH